MYLKNRLKIPKNKVKKAIKVPINAFKMFKNIIYMSMFILVLPKNLII